MDDTNQQMIIMSKDPSSVSEVDQVVVESNDTKDNDNNNNEENGEESENYYDAEDALHLCNRWISDRKEVPVTLPKPNFESSEAFTKVENFISETIMARHLPIPPETDEDAYSTYQKAHQSYRVLLDLLRKRNNPDLLHKVLLALRTSGNGSTLRYLSSFPKVHSNMLHLIFRLMPFALPGALKKDEDAEVLQLLKDFKEQRMNTANNGTTMEEDKIKAEIKKIQAKFKDKAAIFENFSIADAHLNLIVALVSANSVFLSPAMASLWRMVLEQNTFSTQSDNSKDHSDETSKVMRIDAQKRHNHMTHAALATMLRLCPKGKSELFPILASNFPFKTHPTERQIFVAKNCITVLNYVPTLHGKVLELLVDKALEIDVEIKINDSGLVSLEEEKEDHTDGEDIVDTNSNDQKEDNDETKINEFAEKLDRIMLLIFQHVESSAKSMKKGSRYLYQMVLPIFDSIILTTHRSKYVQFIMFYLCALDAEECSKISNLNDDNVADGDQPSLYREFASKLIKIIIDPYRATITRQISACFLASFVSRASFVCAETVCESVAALLRFAEAYMDHYPTKQSSMNGNTKREQCEIHSLFYTVCQAAFYVMCFRGKDALHYYQQSVSYHKHQVVSDHENDDLYVPFPDPENINIGKECWDKLCSHHLQPLRYCLESVRGEFLLLANSFQIMDEHLLQRMIHENQTLATGTQTSTEKVKKKASSIQTAVTLAKSRMKGGVGGLGKGSNPLDTFFPFDPYLLRLSYKFIEPYYNDWNGSAEPDEDMEDENVNALEADASITDISDDEEEEDDDFNHTDYQENESEYDSQMVGADDDEYSDEDSAGSHNEKSLLHDSDEPQEPLTQHDILIQDLRKARAMSIGDECW